MSEPRFYVVPKDTQPSRCRSAECGERVYWIETPRIKKGVEVQGQTVRLPIDCCVAGGSEPDSLSAGKGVSPFTTCAAASDF